MHRCSPQRAECRAPTTRTTRRWRRRPPRRRPPRPTLPIGCSRGAGRRAAGCWGCRGRAPGVRGR
eukprot:scaffold48523_cov44-Phaeocystis_antarctica.AAC.4